MQNMYTLLEDMKPFKINIEENKNTRGSSMHVCMLYRHYLK